MPTTWAYTFVEPGVNQRYPIVITVPTTAVLLILLARFDYTLWFKQEWHEAEYTCAVEGSLQQQTAAHAQEGREAKVVVSV